ncbi:hypothetical protein AB0O91_36640 [Kitasatospora sp. NPDC089797]|uniref:hypothetical protein n=1 Tax=Kitasatospora sp. NPDC089797 TaxID=3155298 RepID=UPI0034215906
MTDPVTKDQEAAAPAWPQAAEAEYDRVGSHGRRQSRLADLQGNYGLLERPIADSYRAEAQVCLEEAEAHELEPAILAAARV